MYAVVTPILTLLAAAAIYVRADPNPNSPSPGDVFIQGQSCAISWDVDPTGVWKTMKIEFMTGDNFDMSSLMTVATVDGTNPSKNTFSYTCPQVSPHSAIYFYQFTSPSTANKTWTGRFAITDSAKNIVAPSQSTQPNGEKIPWGTGSLVNGSSSATPSGSGPSVAASSTGGTPTSSAPSITPGSSLLPAPASYTSTSRRLDSLTSNASATPSTGSTTGANGAVGMLSVSNILFQIAPALALAAFGFIVMV